MNKLQYNLKKEKAFTLIELVMVIVILGILAATALPKFTDLSSEANQSAFDTVKAGFVTSANVVHMKSLINQNATGFPDVSLEGRCIIVNRSSGYPAINQSGACTPVAFIPKRPPLFFNQTEPSLLQLIASTDFSGMFISSAHAAPPSPTPPPLISELPGLLVDFDFTGWVWNKTATTGTLTSPEGLTFTYNQTTGKIN